MLTNEHYKELETVPNPDGGLIPNPKYKENSDFFLKSDYDRDAPKDTQREDVNLDLSSPRQVVPVIQRDVSPKLGLPSMNMPVPENFDYSFDVLGEVHEVNLPVSKADRRAARGNSGVRVDISNPTLEANVLAKNLDTQREVKSV